MITPVVGFRIDKLKPTFYFWRVDYSYDTSQLKYFTRNLLYEKHRQTCSYNKYRDTLFIRNIN